MNLFKKKKDIKTVQELKQEIMDIQFEVLKGFLEMNAIKNKIEAIQAAIDKKINDWQILTKQLDDTKDKIKEEINDTISNGTKTNSELI